MFEDSCSAATKFLPQHGAVVALIGGTLEEMVRWAKANLDPSVGIFIPAASANSVYAVRGETFSGAVIFNEETYKKEGLLRSIHNSLSTVAALCNCLPSELIHYVFAPESKLISKATFVLTPSETLPPTRVLQANFEVSEAEIGSASEFNVAEIALSAIGLSAYITETDGSVYFHCDLKDYTAKESSSFLSAFADDLQADLRSVGYQIDDVQIEHDCISGTLIPLETNQ